MNAVPEIGAPETGKEKKKPKPLPPPRQDLWVSAIWDIEDLGNVLRLEKYSAAQKHARAIAKACPEARLSKLGRIVRFNVAKVKEYLGLS